MVKLKVYWTQTAIKQRNHAFDYWNKRNRSKSFSRKLNIAIKERTNLLKKHPDLGKATNYEQIKAVSLGHYSILYLKQGSKIIISGFWDNRQDPCKLLKHIEGK
ncbi:type II toxin-antitoxin system RelE/ParE family toxin [Carboxylicivirga sp. N1Y90]|uniref:type II toxin-antitoxin system RelE/ParE family toxin n=1 Tax=Carboxylicivirga fragile TaxID=3417571 RepID=UPI003D34730B|nr:type II toxin-antitoxin system RelE/ParE family toxin [Marinilabiliaceae bacterium N1Y90]